VYSYYSIDYILYMGSFKGRFEMNQIPGGASDNIWSLYEAAKADRDRWKERCLAAEALFRECYNCLSNGEDNLYLRCSAYRKWLELIHKMEAGDER
jgi:hypothetical protein